MPDQTPKPFARLLYPLLLIAATAAFLAPYVFLGRSMVPLDLVPIFQPWAAHARELWGSVPTVENPLLDSVQQYYPRRVYMQEALGGGWLPLWNPSMYGGTPFLGSQQGATLYPPAWALSLLPAELQFGWSALLHLSLAAIGAFLFFRELSLRPVPAMVGGLAFALNGFIVAWLAYPNVTQWTLCWLPLALFLWERGRGRGGDFRWLAGSGGVLALALLGGHGQSSMYVLLTWGAWALFRSLTSPHRGKLLVCGVLLPGALCLLLALGHLLPTLDYVPRTDRAGRVTWESVHLAAMPPSQLWTFLLPRLFGDNTAQFAQEFWLPVSGQERLTYIERTFYPGVSVLVLGAAALPLLLRRRRAGKPSAPASEADPSEHLRRLCLFSLALTVVVLLLALGTPVYWPFWKLMPGFGQFTAVARVVGIAAWSLACLAALGTEAITHLDDTLRRQATRALAAAAGVGVGLTLAAHYVFGGAAPEAVTQFLASAQKPSPDAIALGELGIALAAMIAPACIALVSAPRTGDGTSAVTSNALGWIVLVVVMADLFLFGSRYNPATDPKLIRTETSEIKFLKERRASESFRFLSAGPVGSEIDVRRRLPSNLPATFGLADIDGSDSFVPQRYREWERATRDAGGGASPWTRFASPNLRAAAVRYYLTSRDEVPPALRAVAGPMVREDPEALPFARLHTNAQAMAGEGDLLAALANPNRLPLIAMTFGPDAPSFNGPPSVMPFAARRVNGNRLLLEGRASRPGLLVVAEQFDPGWRARVDGKPARIHTADHLFMGVPLPAGNHQVELTYAPDSFRVGFFGSLLGVACLAAFLCARGRTPTVPTETPAPEVEPEPKGRSRARSQSRGRS